MARTCSSINDMSCASIREIEIKRSVGIEDEGEGKGESGER